MRGREPAEEEERGRGRRRAETHKGFSYPAAITYQDSNVGPYLCWHLLAGVRHEPEGQVSSCFDIISSGRLEQIPHKSPVEIHSGLQTETEAMQHEGPGHQ